MEDKNFSGIDSEEKELDEQTKDGDTTQKEPQTEENVQPKDVDGETDQAHFHRGSG